MAASGPPDTDLPPAYPGGPQPVSSPPPYPGTGQDDEKHLEKNPLPAAASSSPSAPPLEPEDRVPPYNPDERRPRYLGHRVNGNYPRHPSPGFGRGYLNSNRSQDSGEGNSPRVTRSSSLSEVPPLTQPRQVPSSDRNRVRFSSRPPLSSSGQGIHQNLSSNLYTVTLDQPNPYAKIIKVALGLSIFTIVVFGVFVFPFVLGLIALQLAYSAHKSLSSDERRGLVTNSLLQSGIAIFVSIVLVCVLIGLGAGGVFADDDS